jgi:predicted ATPase with chaperone activity
MLAQAMTRLSLSARAYHRVLKMAPTVADLAGADTIARGTWPRRWALGYPTRPAFRSDA